MVEPQEIIVIPQGIRFSVLIDKPSRGYILEVLGVHFQLPDLGPIGANGLANPNHFLSPQAYFIDEDCNEFRIVNKFQGVFFETVQVLH